PEPPLRAYSGKDGRTLWKAGGVQGTLRGGYNYISDCFRLECRDLERRGRPAVVCVYGVGSFDIHTSRHSGGDGSPNECWLAVLSGSNGNLLWKEKIGGAGQRTGDVIKCPKSFALTPPAFADLNGDGVLDVVVLAQSTPAGKSADGG